MIQSDEFERVCLGAGDTPRIEDVGSTSWKQLRSSRGMLEMMMMMSGSRLISNAM